MNRFSSLLPILALSMLVGCAETGAPPAGLQAQDVQEGIGGDLAAVYVKAVGFHSLDDGDDRKEEFSIALEKSLLHSSERTLPSLFAVDGRVILIDRVRVVHATQREIVMELLEVMGYPDLQAEAKVSEISLAKIAESYTPELNTALSRTQNILEISKSKIYVPRISFELAEDFGVMSADVAVGLLSKVFPVMRWELTEKKLVDRNTKKEVDAIRGRTDENGRRTVLISKSRLASAGPLVAVMPALMIHETAHCYLLGQTGDDVTYAFTMKLFSPSLLFL